ncbi:MAG: exodeoxyribonuclease V subunit gamma [Pseudomonadota bacterium]
MLFLYESNRLEYLYEMLVVSIFKRQQHDNPLEPKIVVVQSKGMGRWLNFRLAQSKGIAANVNYPLPASFFWQILNLLLGKQQRRSAFAGEVMTFRVMRWLESDSNINAYPMLQQYLIEGGDYRRYELAVRIADAFDQYLVYRPDWLSAWESNQPALTSLGKAISDQDALWQAAIWRDLVLESADDHRARSLAQLFAQLERGEGIEKLPKRIALVGISNLPPVYMHVLKALSKHIDVLFFALNPCSEPWGGIRDESEQERLAFELSKKIPASELDPSDLYLEVGHPLLARWGKQGRDFFDSLIQEAELESVFDEIVEPKVLLHWLQRDILMLTNRSENNHQSENSLNSFIPWDPILVSPDDRSLQIHVCHSEMREIEVLHDQLLALFSENPLLKPSDIVVLTPDIETYAPLIESVFAPQAGQPTIPFSIADRSFGKASALTQVFITLLELPESRMSAEWVLKLLDVEAIRSRFGIEESALTLIHHWVKETGVRWGQEGKHKEALGLPPTEHNTWREGLTRLMLGIVLPHEAAQHTHPLYENILAFDDVEGSSAQVAAKFSCFVNTLFDVAESLKGSATLGEWVRRLDAMLDQLLNTQSDEDSLIVQCLRAYCVTLNELAEQADYHREVELSVVRSWMKARLESEGSEGGFLTGGVTFCTIVPMRSLPFRVVCLLGMDDLTFPRPQRVQYLDLIARYPRKGDRSRRADDRFLLLETLLSARDILYFSYVGKDIRTDQELPSSILVADLVEVIKKTCIPASCLAEQPDDEDKVTYRAWKQSAERQLLQQLRTVHPLQAFDAQYFNGTQALPGFSALWCRAAHYAGRGLISGRNLLDKALTTSTHDVTNDSTESIQRLDIDELFRALANPAQHLLQRRCGLSEARWSEALPITEPFSIEWAERKLLRYQAWEMIEKGYAVHIPELARATGVLPHGEWGMRLERKERKLVERLHQQAESYLAAYLHEDKAWRLLCKPDIELTGWLSGVRDTGLVFIQHHKITPYSLLSAWLKHLALCWSDVEGKCSTTTLIDETKIYQFKQCLKPDVVLADLVDIYRKISVQRLSLFRKTSAAYAESLAAALADNDLDHRAEAHSIEEVILQVKDKSLESAKKAWEGSWIRVSSGGLEKLPAEWESDPWLERLWRNHQPFDEPFHKEFCDLAQRVWLPLYRHLVEI